MERKLVKLAAVVACSLVLFTGCEKKEEVTEEKFEYIRIQENASTGYTWEYIIDEEGIFDVQGSEYTQPVQESEEELVGAPGYRTFRLVGLKEGKTTITLNYVSPGEKKKVSETAKYEVTVDKDLNLTVVSVM